MNQVRVSHPVSLRRRAGAVGSVMMSAGLCLSAPLQLRAATPTTTAMTLTVNGSPVTSVEQHTAITLTATVKAGATTLKLGQVKFCDAAATYCEDSHLLGTSQLTAAGSAVLRFIPGPGSHHYKAVFAGTTTAESSPSAASTLTVAENGPHFGSKTTASVVGSAGVYTLTTQVSGVGSGAAEPPSGVVYFQDKNDSDRLLGKAVLPPASPVAVNYLQPKQYLVSRSVALLGTGDFNEDGKPDVAMCNESASPLIALGTGDGRFTEEPTSSSEDSSCASLVTGDFNSDGHMDLVISYGTQTSFYAGYGNGRLADAVKLTLEMPPDARSVTVGGVGDFNHDGIPDLLVNYGTMAMGVQLGRGDGTFKAGWSSTPNEDYVYFDRGTITTVAGDLNGDGILDFAVLGTDEYYIAHYLYVFYGKPDGSYSERTKRIPYGSSMAIGDMDGDGRADLIIADSYDGYYGGDYYPSIDVFLSRQGGKFAYQGIYSPAFDGYPESVLVGDFNGDGILDVAYGVYFDSIYPVKIDQEIWLGKGDGTFSQSPRNGLATTYNFTYPPSLATADFNGDGLADTFSLGYISSTQPIYSAQVTQLGRNSSATIQPPVGPGTHHVVARYAGDDNYVTSAAKPLALTALPSPAPVANLSTLIEDFGEQPVGSYSNAQTVLLTNAGTAALQLSTIAVQPASYYSSTSYATSNNCPGSLAPGKSCKIRLRFVPATSGAKFANLVITDNAANSPQIVALSGTGIKEP